MTKLEEMKVSVIECVKKGFEEVGEIAPPIWFMHDENGQRLAVVTPMGGPAQKDEVVSEIKKFINEYNISRYVFVMEAWFATCEPEDKLRRPSLRPDRREAVCFVGADRGTGEHFFFQYEIDRSSGKPVLKEDGDLSKFTEMEGRLVDNMFDPPRVKH